MTSHPEPPMGRDDKLVWPMLERLAACLCQTIEDDGCEPLCFCGIVPGGGVAFDYIHDEDCALKDGMAWTRLITMYPSRQYPQPMTTPQNCGVEIVFNAEVGLVRSFPIGEDGEPPDAATYQAYSERQVYEAATLRRAILCCFGSNVILGVYNPIGPAGGAVGGQWTLTAPTSED